VVRVCCLAGVRSAARLVDGSAAQRSGAVSRGRRSLKNICALESTLLTLFFVVGQSPLLLLSMYEEIRLDHHSVLIS